MKSISMSSLLDYFSLKIVDYLKMDIEGAEYEVLQAGSNLNWLSKIRLLNLEYHRTDGRVADDDFFILKKTLEKEGFEVYKSSTHWSAIIAVNKRFQNS